MIFKTEQELVSFAEKIGKNITPPMVFELIGDVGAGKTTFTRALAKGLGVKAPVTSPSFTISNRYYFDNQLSAESTPATDRESTPITKTRSDSQNLLIHYDFYRLNNPGIMRNELEESLANKNAIIVLEWAETVKNLLPKDRITISFQTKKDGSRLLDFDEAKINELLQKNSSESNPVPLNTSSKTPDNNPTAKKFSSQSISLYLDTSDFIAKTIISDEKSGESYSYSDELGHEMAEKLLATLRDHLKEHDCDFKNISKITFMSGPGSFTGLRIGATIVNTLSSELKIPLYDHKGNLRPIIIPDYGRPANISAPRK